jgi:hypothetical protein
MWEQSVLPRYLMVYVTKSFCRFASFPVLGATLTRDEDVGAIRASEMSKVMVYALELPILLVLLLLLLLLLLTTSTNGTASTSACNGVVATVSRPCNGIVAEPFCRFAPYPMEGASLTRDEDVGAIRASEISNGVCFRTTSTNTTSTTSNY